MSSQSVWTRFLRKEEVDPYAHYNDQINMRCHEIISQSIHDLQMEHPDASQESIQKMAINLVMAQMLELQYHIAPDSQTAMVASLLEDLPQMQDFRTQFIGDIQQHVLNHHFKEQKNSTEPLLQLIKKVQKFFKP